MRTTPEQIDRWRAAPSEHQRLEFKSARTQFDNENLYEYCVALANEGGGHLILGIEDKPPRPVVGTTAFNNPIDMEEKLYRVLRFRVDIEEVSHPDGRVLVFHITGRPHGMAYEHKGRYLMRSGASTVPMSQDHLRRIFDEGKPDWLEEPCKEALTVDEVVDLLDTQTFFELLKLSYPSSSMRVIDRLVTREMIDRTANGYSIRRIGALLLAKRLEDFPFETRKKAPRVIVYTGASKRNTKLDQIWDTGYAVGFKSLVQFVMWLIPQNEIIEDALRREVKLVPVDAIRELIANALIHQDFTLTGVRVMIELYADRVEISSPGAPLVSVDRFIDENQSRNERFTDIMRLFSICEEKGSGIDEVINAAEFSQLPAPSFRAETRLTRAILYGPRPFEEMDRDARMRACYQHCALQHVLGKKMTNQSLRDRFKLSESKSAVISQIIGYTLESGLIIPDPTVGRSRKYARYLPFWA
ncbi:MAG: putative DNA binding domain-containing protein [Betaproteobacteria bacterium AqS2]|uniref:DNA binding domain-containing protein n=1 Tax=Candidatus Amphirhobacter heronislandensis TaxID=1732024 RepID=A0A930UDQ6_9GAMM|nr:putative DNA binding domain-containing protein [Betaproteobacteria bacterium AqS2]